MNIVVRSPNWIGDAVMATPAVRALKQGFPDARLTLLAHPRVGPVWENNPHVETHLAYRGVGSTARLLRQSNFDLGVILPLSWSSAWGMMWGGVKERVGYGHQGRGWMLTKRVAPLAFRAQHVTEEYLHVVRQVATGEYTAQPEIRLSEAERHAGEQWLVERGVDPQAVVLAFCPGATYGPAKRWLPNRFAEVGEILRKRFSPRIVVAGHETERELVMSIVQGIGEGALPLVGESLRTVMAVLSACRAALCNDTGLMHVAAALGLPTVGLFGSTSPTWTRPVGDDHHVLYAAVPCSPCFERTCIRRERDYLCMRMIEPLEVTGAVISAVATHPGYQ